MNVQTVEIDLDGKKISIETGKLAKQAGGAVIAIGLMRWHEINSTVGREVGDHLLNAAGQRIQDLLSTGTTPPLFGSIGESTFAAFLPGAGLRSAPLFSPLFVCNTGQHC